MTEKKTYERFTMFDNWGAMFDEMDDESAIKLFRAMYRYAFEGEEPEFDKGSTLSLVWQSVRPNIDASGKAAKGGLSNRSKTTSETPSVTPSETPSRTPSKGVSGTKGKGKGIGKEVGKEKKGKGISPEGKSLSQSETCAADAKAPHVSVACPTCNIEMKPTSSFTAGKRRRIYRCPLCGDTVEVDVGDAA